LGSTFWRSASKHTGITVARFFLVHTTYENAKKIYQITTKCTKWNIRYSKCLSNITIGLDICIPKYSVQRPSPIFNNWDFWFENVPFQSGIDDNKELILEYHSADVRRTRYVHAHICIHMYLPTCTYMHTYVPTYMYICTYICTYLHVHMYIRIYLPTCTYVHTYICTYLHVHTYVHIYVHT
jgi:hypothetical protein